MSKMNDVVIVKNSYLIESGIQVQFIHYRVVYEKELKEYYAFVSVQMMPQHTAQVLPVKLKEDIFKLKPVYKNYIWGGKRLIQDYHKDAEMETIVETWELSSHPQGGCMIQEGIFDGISFNHFLQLTGRNVLGWKCMCYKKFPLLIKLIDANKALSVQVHPDDAYAIKYEKE